jgi:hypothetical protein
MGIENIKIDDRLPFQALVPVTPSSPIDVYEQSAALQMAVVERDFVKLLDQTWDQPGVYVLLDRPNALGEFGVYVGKAPAGIRSRILSHVVNKETWYRAVLIKRDTTHGYNSAHTAWLEGRLYDLFTASTNGILHNKQRPGDDTLASHDLPMLEMAIDPISKLLRLIGHDASDLSETLPSAPTRTLKRIPVTVMDLIKSGLLRGDERLISAISTVSASAQLRPDGTIEFEGKIYPTPSAAGDVARGGSVNGWELWAIESPTGRVRLTDLRAQYLKNQTA